MAATVQSPLNIQLSQETSDGVLGYVADGGEASPEAITKFVEEAVCRRLLDLKLKEIRDRFSDMTEPEIEDLVDEAVVWARSPEGRACE